MPAKPFVVIKNVARKIAALVKVVKVWYVIVCHHPAASTSNNSLGKDLSSDGSFRIDGQRLYNLAIHNNYAAHSIVIDVKGKGFQFYTFTFG